METYCIVEKFELKIFVKIGTDSDKPYRNPRFQSISGQLYQIDIPEFDTASL